MLTLAGGDSPAARQLRLVFVRHGLRKWRATRRCTAAVTELLLSRGAAAAHERAHHAHAHPNPSLFSCSSAADLYKRFDELLEASPLTPSPGDTILGTVAALDRRGALVDLGAKSPALCATSELALSRVERPEDVVRPGDAREFVVVREDNRTGELHLSIRKAEEALLWRRLRQMYEEAALVDGYVTSFNASGLMVEVQGQKGFVPGSHVPNSVQPADLVGQTLTLKLLEVDEERQRLVLSNRRRPSASGRAFRVGDVVLGTVSAVQVYGAFIDLGSGVNGLLHVSQISHDHVASIDKVLAAGDKVKVLVLTHDRERGRISLSTKKLEPTPGDMLRNPGLVFERADETAAAFRAAMAAAESAAREGEGGAVAAE